MNQRRRIGKAAQRGDGPISTLDWASFVSAWSSPKEKAVKRLRSRSRSACALLAVGGALAATLLGAGVSQAQSGGGGLTCPAPCADSPNVILAVRVDLSAAPANYPNPAVGYYATSGSYMILQDTPSFAYSSTNDTLGWYGVQLTSPGVTWTTASTATGTTPPATPPANPPPALVLRSAQTTPATLRGAAATTSSGVAVCPPDQSTNTPAPVIGLIRYANQYGYTSGIRVICSTHEELPYNGGFSPSVLWPAQGIGGLSPAAPQQSASCAAGAVGVGFSVGAGEVLDNVSLQCAVAGSRSVTPILGPGVRTGTALCPTGYLLSGLRGTVNNNWNNSIDVVGLTGICTQYPNSTGLGAVGGGVLAYKGSSRKGAVKFSVAAKRGRALGASKSGWDYTLGGFQFATGCSRASAKVPGRVAVFARENAGQRPRFNLTSGGFSVTGKLSGALSKPKVAGRLKILTGACKGKTLRFTAKASR